MSPRGSPLETPSLPVFLRHPPSFGVVGPMGPQLHIGSALPCTEGRRCGPQLQSTGKAWPPLWGHNHCIQAEHRLPALWLPSRCRITAKEGSLVRPVAIICDKDEPH